MRKPITVRTGAGIGGGQGRQHQVAG